MEIDENELATETAVQEASIWRRRSIHLPADYEERIEDEKEELINLIESGYEGRIRLGWGIRLCISVRREAIWAASQVIWQRWGYEEWGAEEWWEQDTEEHSEEDDDENGEEDWEDEEARVALREYLEVRRARDEILEELRHAEHDSETRAAYEALLEEAREADEGMEREHGQWIHDDEEEWEL